ncbi:sugar ABC transporter ATP-binding protein [uncultured Vibrio sp.]|uniref:sugar ABC transporter ATP-binding protein n=1 Tax=uncultured Vibrio sp. TaxID=114054 RepID=UPI002AABEB36|nr:sugar ABC transporter ATP-binding protein [uncultured Vibrio sp.]
MSSDLGNNDVVLRAQGISKHFPGVKALQNVDFSLRKGEIMALLGENGAGKSTLVKTLTGVYQRDAGDIYLDGQSISPQNTAHAQQLGIGTVYQEVNLLPNMSVMDNLFIGNEPKKWGLVDRKRMAQQAMQIMSSYGFNLDVTQALNSFSVAIQQVISIARAVSLSAKILILDEPTASLDSSEVSMLFGIMRDLREKGISLVFITHFLDQVYEVSDRITVLRNGELVGTKETSQLPQIERVKWMLGRELEDNALKRAGKTKFSDEPVAEFSDYGKRGTIEPFDLKVHAGEIVGLAGLLGSGRQASLNGLGFCPEDRKTDGIVGAASVRENIILALQAQRGWFRPISRADQEDMSQPRHACG